MTLPLTQKSQEIFPFCILKLHFHPKSLAVPRSDDDIIGLIDIFRHWRAPHII